MPRRNIIRIGCAERNSSPGHGENALGGGYQCALQGCGETRAAGHQFCCREHGMIGDQLRADEAALNALETHYTQGSTGGVAVDPDDGTISLFSKLTL